MASVQTGSVASALRAHFHFACVSGPDLGALVAVSDGEFLGQELGLADRYTEGKHVRFTTGPNWVALHDYSSVNRVWSFGKHRKLRVGKVVRVGGNRWMLRTATAETAWLPATAVTKHRLWLPAVLMPVLLLFSLWRFLPRSDTRLMTAVGAAIAGIIVVVGATFWLRRRKTLRRKDPAALLLELARRPQAGSRTLQEIPYYVRPGSFRVANVRSTDSIGAVGANARERCLWVVAQSVVAGHTLLVSSGAEDPRSKPGGQLTSQPSGQPIAQWARTAKELVGTPQVLLPATGAPGRLWADQVEELLKPLEALPTKVDLAELVGPPTKATVLQRWENPQIQEVPLGVTDHGPLAVNLRRDGPHALFIGGTGSGKSEALATLVISLAATYSPSQLRFVFIDYKGGAGLEHLGDLPHVERTLTDLDGALTPWLLRALRAQIHTRKTLLRGKGFRSFEQWQSQGADAPPSVVVIADEVALLAQWSPDLLAELLVLATQGRSLGVHLVLATQRSGGVIDANMKAVVDLRVALRCVEPSDSIDALGVPDAAALPRQPGRAVALVQGELLHLQTAYCPNPHQWVEAITSTQMGEPPPVLPAPLPTSLTSLVSPTLASVPGSKTTPGGKTIGVFESNTTAELLPLVWEGNALLVVGESEREAQVLAEHVAHAVVSSGHASRLYLAKATGHSDFSAAIELLEDLLKDADMPHGSEPSSSSAPVVVVPEFSSLLEMLTGAVGFDMAAQFRRRLMRAAEMERILLVASDSRPHPFPSTLFQISSRRQLSDPRLLTALSLPGGTHEHWVGSTPGRVVAVMGDKEPVRAQIFAPATPITTAKPWDTETNSNAATVVNDVWGDVKIETADSVFSRPGPNLKKGTSLLVVGQNAAQLDQTVEQLGGIHTFTSTAFLSDSEWINLSPSSADMIVVHNPSREVARMLTADLPTSHTWVLSALPLDSSWILFRYRGEIGRLRLPLKA